MKILEVRDGFIVFEADSNIHISSFIQTDGVGKNYVAQVVQLKKAGSLSIASAKILFLYDGTLRMYDNTLPSRDLELKEFAFDILSNSINVKKPIIAGKTLGHGENIVVDESAFDKKMLFCIDDSKNKNLIIRNFTRQFNNLGKNVIVIDTHGVIEANKYKAGVDFKLPLDTAALTFMYQECLNDATDESKSLIVEIFKDLSDYSKTVPFVPFETLKTIVDDMVDKSHIFKLLVLKNKLAKLDKLGCFAKNKGEVDKVNEILNSKCAVIDLSNLDRGIQNRYLAFLYEKMLQKDNTCVILELSNTVNKKNLKNIMESGVQTVFSVHSHYQYLNDIKNFFDNFIITPSAANNETFKIYSTLLKSMPEQTYLLFGEAVNYIPIVSKLEYIQDKVLNENNREESEQPEELSEGLSEEIIEEPEPEIVETECCIVTEPEETFERTEDISNEEIIANIEEKSDAIIQEVSKDLTPPPENVFGGEDESDIVEQAENSNIVSEDREIEDEVICEGNFETGPEEESSEEVLEAENKEELQGVEQGIEFAQTSGEENSCTEQVENFSEEVLEEPGEALNLEISENNILEELSDEISTESAEELAEYSEEETIEGSYETIDFLENDENNLEATIVEESLGGEIPMLEEGIEEAQSGRSYNEFVTDFTTEEVNDGEAPLVLKMPDDFNVDFNIRENSKEELEIQQKEEIPNVLSIYEDDNSIFEEITELEPSEIDEDAIIVDIEDEESSSLNDEDIIKEVDKVFTTRKEDDISDSDLDLIDELNSDDLELQLEGSNDEILQELSEYGEEEEVLDNTQDDFNLSNSEEDEILETRNSSTPIVPVYDADIPNEDMVISDNIEQGDSVTHAKYGSGVVEKMIKYGNKTLYSINFDNIGRRLLDPTLTEIKKA